MKTEPLFALFAAFVISSAGPALAADGSEPAPKKEPPKKVYQICLMPLSCGRSGPGKNIPKKKAGKNPALSLYVGTDPLSRTILHGSTAHRDGGVVSAVRLKPDPEGDGKEKIIYHGTGSLSLPDSAMRVAPKTKNGGAGAEWVMLDAKGKAGDQINGMRDERKALEGGATQSRQGLDRMWNKKK